MRTSEEPDLFKCMMAIVIIITLGYMINAFDQQSVTDRKPARMGRIYFNTSKHNTTGVIEEFAAHYNDMFIELTAFYNFSFIVQYQLNRSYYRYDYVCDHIEYCQQNYTFVTGYKVIRFLIVHSHQEHNIVKGAYLLYV